MTVAELIDELERELEESPKVMFSSELAKVDTDKCLDILDEIKEIMPIELDRAVRILKEREQVLGEAQMQAHKIITDAEERAALLVSQDEIVRAAEEEAQRIIAKAEAQADELRAAGYNFSRDIIADCENYVGGCLEDLRAARAQLEEGK